MRYELDEGFDLFDERTQLLLKEGLIHEICLFILKLFGEPSYIVWFCLAGQHVLVCTTPTSGSANDAPSMERVLRQKIALAPNARMKQLISITPGQIERILEEDLKANAPNALLRGFQITDVQMDENPGHHRQWLGKPACLIRCKYPVGADGAHSTVRKRVGIAMEGDSTDHVWGVIDFVTDTDFPDIRSLTTVQNRFGMAMGIPREKNAQGEWRTRFYADMNDLEVKRRQVVHDIHDTNETVLVENRSRLTTFTSA